VLTLRKWRREGIVNSARNVWVKTRYICNFRPGKRPSKKGTCKVRPKKYAGTKIDLKNSARKN
jgi:hypothetical protein